MDSYAMKAATQIALGDNFGYVGYVFVLAFFTNLLLVLFGRYTAQKVYFLPVIPGSLIHRQYCG